MDSVMEDEERNWEYKVQEEEGMIKDKKNSEERRNGSNLTFLNNWNKSVVCIYTGILWPTEKLLIYQEKNIYAEK
jgi:hypothetical protein